MNSDEIKRLGREIACQLGTQWEFDEAWEGYGVHIENSEGASIHIGAGT